jgi:hypothetical protein
MARLSEDPGLAYCIFFFVAVPLIGVAVTTVMTLLVVFYASDEPVGDDMALIAKRNLLIICFSAVVFFCIAAIAGILAITMV